MIVACPSCGARYQLSESAAAQPRRLRCAECRHEWLPEPIGLRSMMPPVSPRAEAPPAPKPKPATPTPPKPQPQPAAKPEPPVATARSAAPAPEPEPVVAPPPPPPPPRTRQPKAEPPPEPVDETEDEPVVWEPGQRELDMLPARLRGDEKARRRAPLLTIGSLLLGIALAIVAASLWAPGLPPFDPSRIPFAGGAIESAMARFQPAASPVKVIAVHSVTTELAGGRVLDLTVRLRNDSNRPAPVPTLLVELSGPAGRALSWRIPPSGGTIPAHGVVEETSSATGFPRDATRLSITIAR